MRTTLVILLLALFGCQPAEPPAAVNETTPSAPTYSNLQLLVETDWLAEHWRDPGLRLVDARSEESYREGHLPGAISIPRAETFDPDAPNGTVGKPEAIAELFGSRGIDASHQVVVYDEGLSTAAARIFWTLEYYGHPNVSVLNGGFGKWKAESRELVTDAPQLEAVRFTVAPREETRATREELLGEVGGAEVVMMDARAPEEYRGERLHSERGGHLPGAVNIDWRENFVGSEAPVFKSAMELETMYEQAGVTKDKRVHTY